MTRFLTMGLSIALLVACGGEQKTDVEQLTAKRDSLRKEYNAIAEEIRRIETEIEEINPSEDFTLVTGYTTDSGTFEHFFKAYGEVEAKQNIVINAEASGTVQQVFVREGQRVSAGQRLLQIDSEVIQRNIEEVETQLTLARDIYERQSRLWDQNVGSEVQYLEAKNRVESLEKTLATLRSQLSKTTITAPFSGIVDEVFPKEGELAGPGAPMIRLVNMNRVYIQSDVSEVYVGRIEPGTFVQVDFPSIQKSYNAEITRVGSYINPNNRTFEVEVDLTNTDDRLKPNLLAIMNIRDFKMDNAVAVPSRLIQQDVKGQDYLFVIVEDEDGTFVERRVIQTGLSYEDLTLVESGLSVGDRIVDKGSRSINDGQQVTVKRSTEE